MMVSVSLAVSCLRVTRRSLPASLAILLLLTASKVCQGQVRVAAGFFPDSMKVGEQTAFYLSAKYPSDLTVLFPDSAFGYSPFEYSHRKYFPTETKNGISTDSTLYFLTTFEIGRRQALRLPVYVVNAKDCTEYFSNRDSISIIQLVDINIDSLTVDKLPLKETTAYHPVDVQFNYFVLLIVLVATVIVVVVVWLFFGRRISAYLAARKLKRKHNQFTDIFNSMVLELQANFSRAAAESALSAWKKYMEDLDARPYTKLTSRETVRLLKDEGLATNLTAIDRAIYGHDRRIVEPLEHLRVVADQHFSRKLQEVKHAK